MYDVAEGPWGRLAGRLPCGFPSRHMCRYKRLAFREFAAHRTPPKFAVKVVLFNSDLPNTGKVMKTNYSAVVRPTSFFFFFYQPNGGGFLIAVYKLIIYKNTVGILLSLLSPPNKTPHKY